MTHRRECGRSPTCCNYAGAAVALCSGWAATTAPRWAATTAPRGFSPYDARAAFPCPSQSEFLGGGLNTDAWVSDLLPYRGLARLTQRLTPQAIIRQDAAARSGASSAVAELGGGLREVDVARHDEDISPELIATIESVHLICIDAHVALDLRAPHRRGRTVIVVVEECRVRRARRLGSHVCHTWAVARESQASHPTAIAWDARFESCRTHRRLGRARSLQVRCCS